MAALIWKDVRDRRPRPRSRSTGVGRVLVAVYAILAIAATGRSVFQIIDRFDEAPIAFSLSALAAVVYIVATLALALGWRRVALLTICFELAGVLVIGTVSIVAPALLGLDEPRPVRPRGDRVERLRRRLPARPARAAGARPALAAPQPRGRGRGMTRWSSTTASTRSRRASGRRPSRSASSTASISGTAASSRSCATGRMPRAWCPTVVTFDRNPLSLIRPDECPPALVSPAQKAELLAERRHRRRP